MAYDKDNQRLYTYTDAQTGEKVGITTLEIYKCLRYNKRDQNGNRQTALAIKYGNINMWSPRKPIKSTEPNGVDYEDIKFANFGLVVPQYDTINDCKVAYSTNNAGWTYARPNELDGDKFRQLDFDGYKHNTPCPFNPFSYPATGTTKIGGHFKAQTTMQAVSGEGNMDAISIVDLKDIKDKYYGIYLVNNQNTARIRVITSDKTIGENGVEVDVKTDQMPTGEYSVIPFISSVMIEDSAVNVTGVKFTPIPNNSVGIITLYDSWFMIVLEAQLSSDNKIKYRYQVTNTDAGARTLSNNYILFRMANYSFDTPLTQYESQTKLINLTIQAGATYDSGWSQPVEVTPQVASNPKVWLSLGNGTEVSFVIPMRSATQQ
jgi:hypothetical protein